MQPVLLVLFSGASLVTRYYLLIDFYEVFLIKRPPLCVSFAVVWHGFVLRLFLLSNKSTSNVLQAGVSSFCMFRCDVHFKSLSSSFSWSVILSFSTSLWHRMWAHILCLNIDLIERWSVFLVQPTIVSIISWRASCYLGKSIIIWSLKCQKTPQFPRVWLVWLWSIRDVEVACDQWSRNCL